MSSDDENKHQNILKAGVLYLAGAWLVVQTIMALTPVFDWPPIFGFGILFMLIPGFPIVLLMTWVFDVTHKDKGWDKADDARKANNKPGKGFQIALTLLAGLALVVMLLDIFLLVDSEPAEDQGGQINADEVAPDIAMGFISALPEIGPADLLPAYVGSDNFVGRKSPKGDLRR